MYPIVLYSISFEAKIACQMMLKILLAVIVMYTFSSILLPKFGCLLRLVVKAHVSYRNNFALHMLCYIVFFAVVKLTYFYNANEGAI